MIIAIAYNKIQICSTYYALPVDNYFRFADENLDVVKRDIQHTVRLKPHFLYYYASFHYSSFTKNKSYPQFCPQAVNNEYLFDAQV